MNFYLYTNIAAWLLISIIFLISFAIEGFTFRKISINQISIISLFVACSAILTGFSNKIVLFGNIRISLGDWIVFLLGLMFGPICGVISGICADTLMTLIAPSTYGYHAGYMFNKCLLGFFGALVFISKSNNRVILKIVILYSVCYMLQSILLNQIWMMSFRGKAAWADLIAKLIKLPITLPIYIFFTFTTYIPINKLLNKLNNEYIWCQRNKKLAKN